MTIDLHEWNRNIAQVADVHRDLCELGTPEVGDTLTRLFDRLAEFRRTTGELPTLAELVQTDEERDAMLFALAFATTGFALEQANSIRRQIAPVETN